MKGDAFWSKDGAQIYFTSEHVDEPYYELPKTELYTLPRRAAKRNCCITIPMDTGAARAQSRWQTAAFIGSANEPVNSYTQPDLWTVELTSNAEPHNLTSNFDYDAGASVFGDNAAPRGLGGNAPIWSADGKRIFEIYAKEGQTQLAAFDAASGAVTDLTHGDTGGAALSPRPPMRASLSVSSPPRRGSTISSSSTDPAPQPRQLTHVNDKLFNQLNLTEPEEIWYESFDGKRIQAWVQKPPGFRSRRKNIRSSSTSTAARTPPTATSSSTSSNGWRRRVTSCSIRIRAGARATARILGTSSSTNIRATISKT